MGTDVTEKAESRVFPTFCYWTSSNATRTVSSVTPLFLCLCSERTSKDPSHGDGLGAQSRPANSFHILQHSAVKCWQLLAWRVMKSSENSKMC